MTDPQKYQRCMVLAGGGFRFGIYLGMYAAACESGRAPDILLASCGGAIAAAIIGNLPDDQQRKAWLCSPQMYDYWSKLKAAEHAKISSVLTQAVRRKLQARPAARIPNLFDDYLFEVPAHLPLPEEQSHVAVAVIGGQMLYKQQEVGQPRGVRKLFAETVFGPDRVSQLLNGVTSPLDHPRWGDHAIASEIITPSHVPLNTAARISMTDMFYFRCFEHDQAHYLGGVVDLFPIEIAQQLAHEVMIEFKESFDQHLAIPAWRAVLGLDGNQRLRYTNALSADIRVDTSDISQALPWQSLQKHLDWRRNRIGLVMRDNYELYVKHMQDQWDYGYQRGLEACQRKTTFEQATVRDLNRFNKAL